ncbi:uncharacterized protein LOC134688225 [Mytilus trossulus]|uniref:uncharacterized protein LOC134688225 n=1 Tax=Mytilus trossulus TaxID=6551 RepID=UPI003004C66F
MYMKNEALESTITSKDFSQLFRDFDKLNFSLNEDILEDRMNISSLPNFVPGEFNVLNLGTLEGGLGFRENQVKFEVTNQWTTKLMFIHYILRCPDDTLWIADNLNEVLQHVKIAKDKVKILSSFSLKIFGIADLSGNIVVSCGESRLKLIDGKTKEITDSVFVIEESFISRGIHITNDQKVVIAARIPGDPFSATGRSFVVVMDQTGNCLATYEKDRNSKPLFTLALIVTTTSNGNICIVDRLNHDSTGRVFVIGHKGNIKGIYSGHHDINTEDKPFKPQCVVATQSYYILVTDWKNNAIHILNYDGDFISYYSLKDLGIKNPLSLALSTPGHFYLGCTGGGLLNNFGKLYSIRFS